MRLLTGEMVRISPDSLQATHAAAGGAVLVPGAEEQLQRILTDGNSRYSWDLEWTAPAPGVGEVTFYLAGNVVNGNLRPDDGDVWSIATPLALNQAPGP